MILDNQHIQKNYIVSGNQLGSHGYGVLILAQ